MPADDTTKGEHAQRSLKRVGPRTDPRGTPQVTECVSDLEPPRDTYSVRYDMNQARVVSESPMEE